MSHWEPVLTDVVRYRGGSLLRHATLLCGNERHRLYTVHCEEPVSGPYQGATTMGCPYRRTATLFCNRPSRRRMRALSGVDPLGGSRDQPAA
jgi:hypothetical protein